MSSLADIRKRFEALDRDSDSGEKFSHTKHVIETQSDTQHQSTATVVPKNTAKLAVASPPHSLVNNLISEKKPHSTISEQQRMIIVNKRPKSSTLGCKADSTEIQMCSIGLTGKHPFHSSKLVAPMNSTDALHKKSATFGKWSGGKLQNPVASDKQDKEPDCVSKIIVDRSSNGNEEVTSVNSTGRSRKSMLASSNQTPENTVSSTAEVRENTFFPHKSKDIDDARHLEKGAVAKRLTLFSKMESGNQHSVVGTSSDSIVDRKLTKVKQKQRCYRDSVAANMTIKDVKIVGTDGAILSNTGENHNCQKRKEGCEDQSVRLCKGTTDQWTSECVTAFDSSDFQDVPAGEAPPLPSNQNSYRQQSFDAEEEEYEVPSLVKELPISGKQGMEIQYFPNSEEDEYEVPCKFVKSEAYHFREFCIPLGGAPPKPSLPATIILPEPIESQSRTEEPPITSSVMREGSGSASGVIMRRGLPRLPSVPDISKDTDSWLENGGDLPSDCLRPVSEIKLYTEEEEFEDIEEMFDEPL